MNAKHVGKSPHVAIVEKLQHKCYQTNKIDAVKFI